MKASMKVLVIDIGGTSVKILTSGQTERRKFPSGKGLTPRKMVAGVKKLAQGWEYDVSSLTLPKGLVLTRQRKRKDHAHEANEPIADGTPGMEGARCPL